MFSLIALLFLISACPIFVIAEYSKLFAGPYEILFKQIGHCANSGTGETSFDKTRITKISRTSFLYSSNFSLPYGFSDEVVLVVSSFVYGNGGWKPLTTNSEIGPACSSVKRLSPKLVKDVAKAMGTWPHLCPNPPGNYTIKNLPLNIELEIPILPYNKYNLEFWLNHKNIRTGCGKIYIDVIPKKHSKKRRH